MSLLLKRAAAFAGMPLIATLAPFLVLPILARSVSTHEWIGIGVGQSAGMMGAIVVGYAWALTGPSLLARTPAEDRDGLYLASFWLRLALFVVVAPLVSGAVWLLVHSEGGLLGIAMAIATVLGGLTPTWFFISLGEARGILYWDVLPRVLAAVTSVPLLLWGVDAVVYPLILCGTSAVSACVHAYLVARAGRGRRRGSGRQGARAKSIREHLDRGLLPTAAEVVGSAYSSGSVSLAGVGGSPQAVSEYSSLFRLYRLAAYVLAAIANALQSYVGDGESNPARSRHALAIHAVVGAMVGIASAATLPVASRILFGERFGVDYVVAAWAGLALAVSSLVISAARHVLMPSGYRGTYLRSQVAAAAVGVPAFIVLVMHFDAAGGAAALAISNLVCLVVMAPVLRRTLRAAHPASS